MYFKRIEMQGFKSFADPVTIEFNEGITCIIGPNGSGKSNISDALRWVLGEQSSKQLRGNKMQDVIFAGTETRKPRGMAEVTLVIDNSTGILPLEYTEVAVTRRMFRSGESEYLINGSQCRLRDIRELFMDTGIGVEGYSIIGQGRIADIVSTKPENRRQIFEEAAGVVLYKSRKTEAENKLKTASENLERVRDIIAEIEGRIGGLKEDSEKAVEYLALRDRYKTLGINIILHNLDNLAASVDSGKLELEELGNKLEASAARLEETEKLLEDNRLKDAELSERYSSANNELLRVIDELNTITSGGELNKEKLAAAERELERIATEKAQAEEKLAGEREELSRLEADDRGFDLEMEQLRNELSEAVIRFNGDSGRSADASVKVENLREKMISINNSNVNRNAEIKTLTNYKKTLSDRRYVLKEEFEGRDKTDSDNRASLERLENEIKEKNSELEREREKIFEIAGNILSVNQHIQEITAEIDEIAVKTNRAIARKSTIEEMESNYEGYNNAVRSLMQRHSSGIIGTVSDIINVPEGYETAVETALGQSLQNIVCERDADAKSAIGWLKSSRSGRATFLPVESVRADKLPVSDKVRNHTGFVGIASDMVTSESRYSEIVDYLLCRVIIADNMDNAVSMAKMVSGGFRIVTTDGEVVNAFGAITGGKFANKTANLLDRKKEISELKALIEGYEKKTRELVESRDAESRREDSLADDREDQRAKVTELEIAFNVLKADRDHAEELVKAGDGAAERYTNEIETIGKDIERADAMIADYQAKIEAAEKEYAEAEAEADKLLTELDDLKPVIEADNEAIVALKVRIGEMESKILSRNEIIERVRDTVTELETAIEDYDEAAAGLEETRALLTSSGEESSDREAELRESKASLESGIADINSQADENRSLSEALMNEQKSVREEVEKIRDDRYKLEVKTARNETLLDTQKDKLWDEFEVSYAEALEMRAPDFAITSGNKESREVRLRLAELGDVNVGAIEEYKSVSKRYEFMSEQENDLTKAMGELQEIISNMDKTIKTRFKENFDQVVINFEESFKELFGGGYAELRLEDETRPLESGIEITAQPPGKKLKNINLLSGGEKTLTAIALMFAVLKAKPTPFVILDEVEAALDEVNIEHFSDYLRNFDNIQFALITHQKATMEHADVLYGVTMPEHGISKMLSLKLGDSFDVEGLE
ncbi:MAG: chromosome segregation protein SMC [Clostridiales bacterium]|nr:chromosome segregation protein SMC [Clostridiales bacterium]